MDVSCCLGFSEHLVCQGVEEVFQPQLDIILDDNPNRPQVLVYLRYDDGLILLDGSQELSLVGSKVLFPSPFSNQPANLHQEGVHLDVNSPWWEWRVPV